MDAMVYSNKRGFKFECKKIFYLNFKIKKSEKVLGTRLNQYLTLDTVRLDSNPTKKYPKASNWEF